MTSASTRVGKRPLRAAILPRRVPDSPDREGSVVGGTGEIGRIAE